MQRSSWTGKKAEALIEVRLSTVDRIGRAGKEETFLVEPKHEAELRPWVGYVNQNAKRFLALVMGLSAVALGGSFLGAVWPAGHWLVALAVALLGVTAIVYPFATPETNAMLGMRTARSVARWGGVLLIAMGAFLALRGF